ncbi:hypothetical protein C8Q74DRAFT_1411100 [Fomes fomentarius]|nr:hypothetical protein C8Q74DRAFT_1411100 [Fomes fomentarius]
MLKVWCCCDLKRIHRIILLASTADLSIPLGKRYGNFHLSAIMNSKVSDTCSMPPSVTIHWSPISAVSPFFMAAPSTNTTAATPALDNTLRAVLIGTFISLVLYGLALHQAYQYHGRYKYNKAWLKFYVGLVLSIFVRLTDHVISSVLGTSCCVLATHACYYYAISNYFKPETLLYVSWSSVSLAIIGDWIASSCIVFGLGNALTSKHPSVACFVVAQKGFKLKTWALFSDWILSMPPFPKWLISLHNAASTVSDIITTGVLIYTLRKSRTGIRRTDSMIMSTGLVTSLYNGICFLTSVILLHDLIYLATIIVGIRLYSNSLLATLNLQRTITECYSGEISLSDTSPFGVGSARPLSTPNKPSRALQSAKFNLPPSSNISSATANSPSNVLDIKVTTELTREIDEDRSSKADSGA